MCQYLFYAYAAFEDDPFLGSEVARTADSSPLCEYAWHKKAIENVHIPTKVCAFAQFANLCIKLRTVYILYENYTLCNDFADKLDEMKTKFLTNLYSDYLHEVGQMWFEIGVLLGVPFNKLAAIDKKHDKLLEVISVSLCRVN